MAFVRMNGGSTGSTTQFASGSGHAYSGDGTTYYTLGTSSDPVVSQYATGSGTNTLTFTKACTLCVFIGTGRTYAAGTSSISIYINGSAIETISMTTLNYTSKMVNLNMNIGDTLKIGAVGTAGGYAIHMWGISVLV